MLVIIYYLVPRLLTYGAARKPHTEGGAVYYNHRMSQSGCQQITWKFAINDA